MTVGTQTKPAGKLLDYEQFIDHQTRADAGPDQAHGHRDGCLTLMAASWASCSSRWCSTTWSACRSWCGGSSWPRACWRVGVRRHSGRAAAVRRVNGIYAAKTIEDADPAFKNSLINYLELRRHRGQMSEAIMATLEARAVSDLTQVEVDTVVNQQRLMRMAYALSAVIVIFCLYVVFAPKSILDSARRAFLADVVRPTNTRLVNIKPGNDPELSQVVAGEHVDFTVDVQGVRPQKVLLHYSVDGGKFFAVKRNCAGRHFYDPWQITLTNVQQSIDYYLTGGDAESLRYHLEVLPAPTVTSITLDLKFPGYTKVPPRPDVEGGTSRRSRGQRSRSMPRPTCRPGSRTSTSPARTRSWRSTPTIPPS